MALSLGSGGPTLHLKLAVYLRWEAARRGYEPERGCLRRCPVGRPLINSVPRSLFMPCIDLVHPGEGHSLAASVDPCIVAGLAFPVGLIAGQVIPFAILRDLVESQRREQLLGCGVLLRRLTRFKCYAYIEPCFEIGVLDHPLYVVEPGRRV
ncbi:hypothetical protein BU23DRAFT_78323 [Bimuria novae-zelandiae CBS 107.79]|uniref:Uncharacterized protein n=1 Tax=Bimuria novae-zelandiae CBS 107.79 TaxID=1447943 RepID=A0A6A5UJW1_9PLEO|nr:hypothetical protein BU23DRAFT_78323 [Bimuria novae-zelandiae CBS 107.79]